MTTAFLPDCWNDDIRMNVMFAPFRSREVNPQGWQSQFQFWANCIERWCKATKHVCFRHGQLMSAFERNGKMPQGLRTVINEMLRQKQVLKLSDLGDFDDNDKWLTWGLNVFVKRPLTWSMSAISNAIVKKEPTDEDYVAVDALKEKSMEVLSVHEKYVEYSSTDNTLELSTLWERCKDICSSELELKVVLLYLRKEKLVATDVSGDTKLVKFAQSDTKQSPQIEDLDVGILRLKKARVELQNRIGKLREESVMHLKEARTHVHQNETTLAKGALRRKKSAEKILAKRESALENVEDLLHKIQHVETEKMVLDAYQSGVDGFRKAMADNGITIDKVDDTMVAIQDMFDRHEEIQDSISQPVAGDTDLSEFEAELEGLMEPEPTLPSPPSKRLPSGVSEDGIPVPNYTDPKSYVWPQVPTDVPASEATAGLKKLLFET